MRSLSTSVTALVLVAALGCSSGNGGNADSLSSSKDSSFKVALLTPGPISDRSWNGGAYDGLRAIRDSMGAATSHIQTRTPADFEENFRQYGSQGYDVVFGHGFEFQDAAERVAPQFPGTVYIVTSGNRSQPPNLAGVTFGFEGASYLAGVLAGSLTRSGVLGVIGGTALPPVESSFDAFEDGARSVRADVRLLSAYVGNWEDASAGRELALAQIRQGADLIFQNADAAGLGVFQAARQAGNVLVYGTNIDQNPVAPDVIIGSVVIDLPRAFLSIAREVQNGTFTAQQIRFGSSSAIVRLVRNPALAARIPPDVHARLDSLDRELRAGELVPSWNPPSSSDSTHALAR